MMIQENIFFLRIKSFLFFFFIGFFLIRAKSDNSVSTIERRISLKVEKYLQLSSFSLDKNKDSSFLITFKEDPVKETIREESLDRSSPKIKISDQEVYSSIQKSFSGFLNSLPALLSKSDKQIQILNDWKKVLIYIFLFYKKSAIFLPLTSSMLSISDFSDSKISIFLDLSSYSKSIEALNIPRKELLYQFSSHNFFYYIYFVEKLPSIENPKKEDSDSLNLKNRLSSKLKTLNLFSNSTDDSIYTTPFRLISNNINFLKSLSRYKSIDFNNSIITLNWKLLSKRQYSIVTNYFLLIKTLLNV